MKRLWPGLFALLLGGVILLAGRDTAVSAPQAPNAPTLSVNLVSSGFSQPTDIANAGDDRLFVVEQAGRIRVLNNGSVLPTPFLDIAGRVKTGSEQGLLGLAFHPDYPDTPYFYVNYSGETDGRTVISRFTVTNNPNAADPASELILLEIDQPYSNHNGGDLNFGPDGYLYIGMGDGGSGGDPRNNAQLLAPDPGDSSRNPLLGKILR
ncbi:MAG TPA: glucose dehydrogenase, partial [Anaerolineae bacterium]|nr:glucose dehydrogenase [Anaerolineae bacterium]